MSGIYNVNKISINGNVINGVDVTNLGISPQHVPSSFAVKKEIAKISEDIDKKIQEELEIYRLPQLDMNKSGTKDDDVPFTKVPNYDGVYIRLIANDSDIEWMVGKGIPEGELEQYQSYIDPIKVKACKVNTTSYEYEKKDVTSYIDDATVHRGWEVKINCAEYKTFSDTYKVPKKIFLHDIYMDRFKVIKITFQDDATSFSDKIHLKSIYAPDVITFGSTLTPTTPLKESNVTAGETDTDAKLHSRIDITTRLFEGQFYPVSNQDIVLHNQSYCDFTNVVAITTLSDSATAGYIKNVICPDTFRAVISNVHKGIKHITLPINDFSVGYKTQIDFGTTEKPDVVDIYGFTELFVDDEDETTPQCVVEIPIGCKLSYRIEHLHNFDSTSNCIKTECFECNYFDAAWPHYRQTAVVKVVYPVDRFRMISENEYFMKEFMGLKNTLIFDCLEKKKSESFDTLGHVNLTLDESKTFFTYAAYNDRFELTRTTIYLSNMLKTDTAYYYLTKKQPTFNTIYPEFEHLTRHDAQAVLSANINTASLTNENSDIDHVKVMLSDFVVSEGSEKAIFTVGENGEHALTYTGINVKKFEPLDSDQDQYVCPKLNYTMQLSDIFDYTQEDQSKNQNLVLVCEGSDTGFNPIVNTFTLKPVGNIGAVSTIGNKYYLAYLNNNVWQTIKINHVDDPQEGLKPITDAELETAFKSAYTGPSVQYVYVRAKGEVTDETYTADNTLFYAAPTSNTLRFDNMIISEKINNQVVNITTGETTDTVLIYYPDLRSFQHVKSSSIQTSLVVNEDILQLINSVFTKVALGTKKYDNLYLTPNALRGVMEYIHPDKCTHKFNLGGIATKVYLPKGYASNAQVTKVLTLPTGAGNVVEYDTSILM